MRAPARKPPAKPKPARKPAPRARSEPPDYSVAAVERALDLLDALARTGPAALVTLAAQAKCTRSNAFRLLRTLQSRGFAIQDEARGVWRLGARWAMLGRASHDQGAMAATAASFLAALGQAVGENVYLRTRDNLVSETVAVYQAEPALRLYSQPGTRTPLHAGPSRLLLAYAPEAVQTQVLTQRLPRFTPATRTDPNWVAADLQRIRSRGFLITADEVHPGAVSISAPIWDAVGHVVAALTVSGPSMRMRPPRPRSLLPQLLDAARRLSAAFGGSIPGGVPDSTPATQSRPPPLHAPINPPSPAEAR
jgi:DNA-binding IclR family transcriptional regulator